MSENQEIASVEEQLHKLSEDNKQEILNWIMQEPEQRLKSTIAYYKTNRNNMISEIILHKPDISAKYIGEMLTNNPTSDNYWLISLLEKCGDSAISSAIKLLDNEDSVISALGANIIRKIGFKALPQLRQLLEKKTPSKRAMAVLIELDPDAINVLESKFEDMLGTDDQILASYAITAAASAGDFAIPILIKLLGDTNPFKQQNSTAALIKMGDIVIPELVEELDNPNQIVQQNASRALQEIGAKTLPYLEKALEDPSPLMRQNASRLISGMRIVRKGFFSRFKK